MSPRPAPVLGYADFPDLDPAPTRKKVRSSLMWRALMRQKGWVWGMFAAIAVAGAVTGLVQPLFIRMVDNGITAAVDCKAGIASACADVEPLGSFAADIITAAFIIFLCIGGVGLMVGRVSYQLEFDLRTWLYTRIQAAELERLDRLSSGQLITRSIDDLNTIRTVLGLLPVAVALIPIVVVFNLVLILVSPPMGLLTAVAVAVNVALSRRMAPRLRVLSFAELNERAEVTVAVDEPVRGIRVVHAFGQEEAERARVRDVAIRVYRFAMARARLIARYDLVLKSVPYLVQAVVVAVGALLVGNGSLSVGTFTFAFTVCTAVTAAALVADELVSVWQFVRASQDRLGEVLAIAETSDDHGADLPAARTGLVLDGVCVEVGGSPVLEDFDLTIAPGQLTVVTGGPGAGKTTVARTAAGLIPHQRGTVLVDGVDLHELRPSVRPQAIRVVSEESFLFAASIRENLLLGAPANLPSDVIDRALHAAGADEVIAAVAGGLESPVGDRGLTLSGGQRQRIALARALVVAPRVLVLDDALSSVQPALEVEILQRIRQHAPDTAVLCISRRGGPATIADAVVELPDREPHLNTAASFEVPAALLPTGAALERATETFGDLVRLGMNSTEQPAVPEEVATMDAAPTVRNTLTGPFKGLIAMTVAVIALMAVTNLMPQLFLGKVSDLAEQGGRQGEIYARSAILVAVAVVGAWAAYASTILAARFIQGSLVVLRRRVFQRLSRLGIDYFDRELPGTVATKVVNDMDKVKTFLKPAFDMTVDSTRILIACAAIVFLAPSTFPYLMGPVVLMAVCTVVQARIGGRVFDRQRTKLEDVTAQFGEDLAGSYELRSLGAVELQTQRFIENQWSYRRAQRNAAIVTAIQPAFMQFLGTTTSVLVLWKAGHLAIGTALSVGTAVSIRLLADVAGSKVYGLSTQYTQLLDTKVSWHRLQEPFVAPILPVPDPAAIDAPALAGRIEFDHVVFSYPHTGHPVLHDISFAIEPGRLVSLVGYTGAGKSSISKLLLRVYDPDRGTVRVDGLDVRALDLHQYRRRLGVVPQDAFVFRGTVASNIAYGTPGAPRAEIEEAARLVGAHEVLASLPGGYDHVVEEAGANLTAAQRQLIALARAWMAEPDILVLDEATSCLDANLEKKVLAAVKAFGRTTIFVTHRQSVVNISDEVIVLDGGRVVAAGPTKKTVKSAAYTALWGPAEPAPATPRRRRPAVKTPVA